MRTALALSIVLPLLLAGHGASTLAQDSPTQSVEIELAYWNAVRDIDDAGGYELYLKKFPNGLFRELAEYKLAALRPETSPPATTNAVPLSSKNEVARWELELAFWNSIQDSKDPGDYNAYLQAFPDGLFRILAETRRDALLP